MPKPRVSIIIPHLNTPGYLTRCLSAVTSQKLRDGTFEVIVVDNGSKLSLEPVKEAFPDVLFLEEQTPGPGPARNLGVQHAGADILAFVDADVKPSAGWLQAALDAIGDDPHGYVGGSISIAVTDPGRLRPVEAYESVFSFRQKKYIEREHYSVTANLVMTRAIFEMAGPFGGIESPEDRQFGERASAQGITPRYAPAMHAFHPPRRDMADTMNMWKRLTLQAYTRHQELGKSLLAWRLRAIVVMFSGFGHIPLVLSSTRISGMCNRLRAIPFLFAVRWKRGLEMLEFARKTKNGGPDTMSWNR